MVLIRRCPAEMVSSSRALSLWVVVNWGRHWPCGVLFDLHTAFDPTGLGEGMGGGIHPHLPWSLTLHFQDYPKDVLTRRESPQSLQDVWLNNLKEVPPSQPVYSNCRHRLFDMGLQRRYSHWQPHKYNLSTHLSFPLTTRHSKPFIPHSQHPLVTSPFESFSHRHILRSHLLSSRNFHPWNNKRWGQHYINVCLLFSPRERRVYSRDRSVMVLWSR